MTQFVPVESSNLAGVGFDPHEGDPTLGVLSVKFKSGAVFQYFDVPAEKFDAFMDAPSKGKFYIANVKGAYDHQCVVAGTPAKPRAKGKGGIVGVPLTYANAAVAGQDNTGECVIPAKPIIRTGNIDL